LLRLIEEVSEDIEKIYREIQRRSANFKEDLKVAISMPSMGFTSASVIVSEIGDFRDFQTSGQFGSILVLFLSVY
jgi:transposase